MAKSDAESDLEEVLSNYDEDPDERSQIIGGTTSPLPEETHPVAVSTEFYNDKNLFDFNAGVDESPVLSVRSSVPQHNEKPEHHESLEHDLPSDDSKTDNRAEISVQGDNKADDTFSPPLSVREDSPPSMLDQRSPRDTTGAELFLKRLSIPVLNLTTVISPLSPQSLEDDDGADISQLTTKQFQPAISVPAIKQLTLSKESTQQNNRSRTKAVPLLKLSEEKKTKKVMRNQSAVDRADVIKQNVSSSKHIKPVRKPERKIPENRSNTNVKPLKGNESKTVLKIPTKTKKLERADSFPEEVQTENRPSKVQTAANAEKESFQKEIRKAGEMRSKPESANIKAQGPAKVKRLSRPGIRKEKQSKEAVEVKLTATRAGTVALSENLSSKEKLPTELPLGVLSRSVIKQERKRMTAMSPKKSLNATYTIGQAEDSFKPINVRLRQLSVKLPKFPSKRTLSKRPRWTRTHAVVSKTQDKTMESLGTKTSAPVYSLGENPDDKNEGGAIRLDKSLQRLVDFTVNDSNHPPQDSYLMYLENAAVAYRSSADKTPAGNESHLTQVRSGIFLESSQQELDLYDMLLTDTVNSGSTPTGNYLERLRYDVRQRHRSRSSKNRRTAPKHSRLEDTNFVGFDEEIPVIQDGNRNINRLLAAEENQTENVNIVGPPIPQVSVTNRRKQSSAARFEDTKEAETELRSRVMMDILKLNDLSPQSLREVMINHFDRRAWSSSNRTLDANQVATILSSIFDSLVLV